MKICPNCNIDMSEYLNFCTECGSALKITEQPSATLYTDTYDIFLSYRRDGGETMAILLRDRLFAKGYRVFLDIENLHSGSFNNKLLNVIDKCMDFLLICSKDSLERCNNDGDWVRTEIAHALQKGKNIVPFMLRDFSFPDVLPDDIEAIRMQNGVNANSHEYFDAAIDRLTDKFLISKPKNATPTAVQQPVQQPVPLPPPQPIYPQPPVYPPPPMYQQPPMYPQQKKLSPLVFIIPIIAVVAVGIFLFIVLRGRNTPSINDFDPDPFYSEHIGDSGDVNVSESGSGDIVDDSQDSNQPRGNTIPSGGGTVQVNGTTNFSFTPSASGIYTIETSGNTGDPLLTLNDPTSDRVIRDDDGGSGLNARIVTELTAGHTYSIIADFYGMETGSYTLSVTMSGTDGSQSGLVGVWVCPQLHGSWLCGLIFDENGRFLDNEGDYGNYYVSENSIIFDWDEFSSQTLPFSLSGDRLTIGSGEGQITLNRRYVD